MLTKKSVTILIIIAIILAGIAIAIQLSDTEEVSTTKPVDEEAKNGGNVGVSIIQTQVEDKLTDGKQS